MKTLSDFGFNGKDALSYCINKSKYGTVHQAVASLTVFTNQKTIKKTQGRNIFKIVRDPSRAKRGHYGEVNGLKVLYDDNTAPTDIFLWANGIKRKELKNKDVIFCHIFAKSNNVEMYTSLANICMIPAFLVKLTDTDSDIKSLLQYRAYELYGSFVDEGESISKPKSYKEIKWAEPLPAINNLEEVFRNAMKTKPKNRGTISARELGWFFSNYESDNRV